MTVGGLVGAAFFRGYDCMLVQATFPSHPALLVHLNLSAIAVHLSYSNIHLWAQKRCITSPLWTKGTIKRSHHMSLTAGKFGVSSFWNQVSTSLSLRLFNYIDYKSRLVVGYMSY